MMKSRTLFLLLCLLLCLPSISLAASSPQSQQVDVPDGNDVTQGAKADAAITNSASTGSISAFLKGLVKIFSDAWDSTNHVLKVGDGTGPLTVDGTVGVSNSFLLDATLTGRFAAAFASADNISAQTSTAVHGLMMGWDAGGSNWDRLRLDGSGNLNVNLNANSFGNLTVLGSGNFTVVQGTGTNLHTVLDSGTLTTLSTLTNITNNNPSGSVAHDGVATGVNPLLTGCYASAAAPADVSTDGDATREWCLKNGARSVNLSTAGTLYDARSIRALTSSDVVTVNNAFLLDATVTNRLPAGAALADATANPTVTSIGSFVHGYNGTTWDRLRVDGSKNLLVALNAALPAGSNVIGHIICDSGCTPGGSTADNSAFTFGTTALNPMGAVLDDVATNSVTENSIGVPRMNASRILYSLPTGSTGTALFAAAYADADAVANQTTTAVHGQSYGYNGTTWDRLQVDGSKNLKVMLNAAIPAGSNAIGSITNSFLLDATYIGRMPAGASPADNETNTNTALSRIGGYTYVFDGATWDRWTGLVTLGANQSVNVAQFGGTNAVTGTGASGAGIPRMTIANDSSLAANQSVNTNQFGGSAVVTGTGVGGAGIPRMTISSDSSLTVTGLLTTDQAAFTPGASTFVASGGAYNATNPALTSGQQGTRGLTQYRSAYSTLFGSNAQELGTQTNPLTMQLSGITGFFGGSSLQDPSMTQIATLDPFGRLQSASTITDGSGRYLAMRGPEGAQLQDASIVVQQSPAPVLQCPYVVGINQTTNTQLVTNAGGKSLHICSFSFLSGGAQNISLVEGTGSTCATGTKGLYGGTTASAAVAANGGIHGTSDRITYPMQTLGDNLCLLQSTASNVSGTLTYGIY